MKPAIVVVGSCMTDLTSYTHILPKPGETVHGTSFSIGFGGKGANQCIAATRLGASTAMVARVGSDSFGDDYLKNFGNNSVDTTFVKQTENVSTGVASIAVDGNGENSIIIVAGANAEMTVDDVSSASDLITNSKIVLCQGELSEAPTMHALSIAQKSNVLTLMNAAPASENMDSEIYNLSDIFCVNESEATILIGSEVNSLEDAKTAAVNLLKKGCREVILTLGENGAVYASSTESFHVPAPKISNVVDTTGAGDSFVGAMAYLLVYNPELSRKRMMENACKIASTSVQFKGAQSSFASKGTLKEILDYI